jgi:DNA-binding NarL/FixJ family response regulator
MTDADPGIRIMLVDDHAVVRAGYRFLLESIDDIRVVAEATSGEEAIARIVEAAPDIVVMDLAMPGIGGLEAIRRIREQRHDIRILVFTMHENAAFVEHVLQAGVDGYISKNSPPDTLVEALRRIAAGDVYIDAQIAQTLVVRKTRNVGSQFASLSSREFQILCMFAEACSVDRIAEELSLTPKTVSNYLTQIKDKLQVSNTQELMRLAISEGLVTV